MRGLRLALGLGFALAGGGALAEAPGKPPPFDARTQITWNPATRVWTGATPTRQCSVRAAPDTAPVRHADLIAEFQAPALTPILLAGAQACAAEAADATGDSALLSSAEAPFQAFRGAFAACLVRHGQADQLGGLRLWVDRTCDW